MFTSRFVGFYETETSALIECEEQFRTSFVLVGKWVTLKCKSNITKHQFMFLFQIQCSILVNREFLITEMEFLLTEMLLLLT